MSVLAGGFLQPALGAYLVMDKFDVVRRTEIVGNNGRVTTTEVTFPGMIGTVGPAGARELDRLHDLDLSKSTLSIVTTFRLQNTSPGRLPDWVVWHGDTYQVMSAQDYTAFGAGFVQAVVQMVDAQPTSPSEFVAAPGSPA